MEKFVITGGNKLQGSVQVSGAKNVALKALIAACLTEDEIVIHNVPLISDFFTMVDIIKELGGKVVLADHTVSIRIKTFAKNELSLETAAKIRTSFMFLAPLLHRTGEAIIPNPGGCRLGARPVDRLVDGLNQMGANIIYRSEDGYFHAKASELHGTTITFPKNTHTGTETLIIAAVLAKGKTVLHNAAEEPEIDELIDLLDAMGADIKRTSDRTIEINGVSKLHGATHTIKPDRNEVITFAIAAIVTKGNVLVKGASKEVLKEFLDKLEQAGGGFDETTEGIRFYRKDGLHAVDVETRPHPGFMTDWQAPWAILMTQANGKSVIHETVFEDKFGYVADLKKMGAKIIMFNPEIEDKEKVYNFNLADDRPEFFHAIEINGPTQLHNAIATMVDLRAGAAIVIAALAAHGTSTIFGIDKLDRGYEDFERRLRTLGAEIKREK
ncbi:MAG TPA: UDP-N-acetylglucosamine 1-carboxyvinyltransferase [Candidatus Acidoferrales bacterium]|nr:UDP-N-acetylglucosamine 1-carboxyvinyltransferase [Candidatus Acidoferrales bacterium]